MSDAYDIWNDDRSWAETPAKTYPDDEETEEDTE